MFNNSPFLALYIYVYIYIHILLFFLICVSLSGLEPQAISQMLCQKAWLYSPGTLFHSIPILTISTRKCSY